eukprot:1161586-Pelagomonas_calceolata.AAC.3
MSQSDFNPNPHLSALHQRCQQACVGEGVDDTGSQVNLACIAAATVGVGFLASGHACACGGEGGGGLEHH